MDRNKLLTKPQNLAAHLGSVLALLKIYGFIVSLLEDGHTTEDSSCCSHEDLQHLHRSQDAIFEVGVGAGRGVTLFDYIFSQWVMI